MGWLLLTSLTLVSLTLAAPAFSATLRLSFEGVDLPQDAPMETTLKIADAGDAETTSLLTSIPGELRLDIKPGTYSLSLEGEGLWAPVKVVTVEAAKDSLTLSAWRTGQIEGRYQLPRGSDAPERARIQFAPPGKSASSPGPDHPKGAIDCQLKPKGFVCDVPRAQLDLKIQFRGFLSHFYWDKRIRGGDALDIGTAVLARGASLIGWVATEDDAKLPKDTSIRLIPRGLESAVSPADIKARDLLTTTGKPDTKGFFQLGPLPEGAFQLQVDATGYSGAGAPIEILGQAEAELRDPMVLLRPLAMSVVVDPPVDASGQPWQLLVQRYHRIRSAFSTMETFELPVSGFWESHDFGAGTFRLTLVTQGGDQVIEREIELASEPMPIQLAADLIQVEGTVLYGEDPLEAEINFGGRRGAVRLKAQSDEEGRFELLLPKRSPWVVDVQAKEPRIVRRFTKFEVPVPKGGGPSRVEIIIPKTRLSGVVVDGDGQPAPPAFVSAIATEGELPAPIQEQVGDVGEFEISGLPAGVPIMVHAYGPNQMASEKIRLELKEDEDEWVELVLRKRATIRGRIIGLGNAVPGARVRLTPVSQQLVEVGNAMSDARGTFEVVMDPKVDQAFLRVAAAGWAYYVDRRSISAEEPLIVELQPHGGLLDVTLAPGMMEADSESSLVVYHRGVPLYVSLLQEWATMHPNLGGGFANGNLRVPQLTAGDYLACAVPRSQLAAWQLGPLDLSHCHSGRLAPQGTLELTLPTQ